MTDSVKNDREIPKKKVKMNIFLMGYFGFGNAGDNFLLKKSVQFFKEQLPGAKLCVSYEDPEKIISVFKDDMSHIPPSPFSEKHASQELTYCNRHSFSEMIIALWRSHVLVFPGGSMLQDMTSFRSLFYYIFLLFSYRLFGKKVYLMSQGIGPLSRPISKWLVLRVLNICHGVSLRDVKSVEALKELGVSEKRLMLASDLAYYNESVQEAPKQSKETATDLLDLFQQASIKKKVKITPSVGLSLRDISITSYSESSLKFFLKSLKSQFIFLSCQDPIDRHQIPFYNGLAGQITEQKDLDALFSQKNGMNKTIPLVIGMRYHACVWASLQGLPFLALAYDDKVVNIAEELKQEYIDLRDPHLSTKDFQDKYEKLLQNYHLYQKELRYLVPQLVQRTQTNIDLVSPLKKKLA